MKKIRVRIEDIEAQIADTRVGLGVFNNECVMKLALPLPGHFSPKSPESGKFLKSDDNEQAKKASYRSMNKGSKELSLERAGSKNLRVRIGEDDFQPEIDYAFEKLDLASLELKAEVAKRKDANSILFGSMPKTNERGKRHLKSKEEDQSLDQSSVFPKEWERSRAQRENIKMKKGKGEVKTRTSDRLRAARINGSKKRLPTGIQSLSSSSEEVQIRDISNTSSS
ncbi:protein Ycf2-like [Cucumis melo var. makuwa]|uniref:Protein Ycf2-like n=1 Tax=Cucumis melo var. makuwa TaxID=1194695 RepID=A0A5D3CEU7_CUCMM|nr:protein Ycf2-like [Cucumis melo var. makuwa]